jgi:hypothetical protein
MTGAGPGAGPGSGANGSRQAAEVLLVLVVVRATTGVMLSW